MNKDLIIELRLSCVRIPPKFIRALIKENIKKPWVEIKEIIKFSINIEGSRRNIFTYVVPVLLNPVIIRLLWIRKDNVIIKPIINTLTINSYGLTILIKIIPVLLKIKELTAAPFAIWIRKR